MEPCNFSVFSSAIDAFRGLAYVQCGPQKTLALLSPSSIESRIEALYEQFKYLLSKETGCTEEGITGLHQAVVRVSHAYRKDRRELEKMKAFANSRKRESWYVDPLLRKTEVRTVQQEIKECKSQYKYSCGEVKLFNCKLSYIEESDSLDKLSKRLERQERAYERVRRTIDLALKLLTKIVIRKEGIKIERPCTLWKPEPYIRYDPLLMIKTIKYILYHFPKKSPVKASNENFRYIKKKEGILPYTLLVDNRRGKGLNIIVQIKKGWGIRGGEKVVKPSCLLQINEDGVRLFPTVTARILHTLEQEVKCLIHFKKNPHVIDLLAEGTYTTIHNEKKSVIVLPMYEGTLNELLERAGSLSADTVNTIAMQLFSTIQSFEEEGFVHGDIKPGNIVYKWLSEEEVALKVIDFGFSYFKKTNHAKIGGTSKFFSPQYAGSFYDSTRDLFALGILLYYLAETKEPAWIKKCATFTAANEALRTYSFSYFEEIEKMSKEHRLLQHILHMLNLEPKVRRQALSLPMDLPSYPSRKKRKTVPVKYDMLSMEQLDLSCETAYIDTQKGLIEVHELPLSTQEGPRQKKKSFVKADQEKGYLDYFQNFRIW